MGALTITVNGKNTGKSYGTTVGERMLFAVTCSDGVIIDTRWNLSGTSICRDLTALAARIEVSRTRRAVFIRNAARKSEGDRHFDTRPGEHGGEGGARGKHAELSSAHCGFSIHTLTLFGLVLAMAIGIVVDDAIVVVEAVQHHIAHGLNPRAFLAAFGQLTHLTDVWCTFPYSMTFLAGSETSTSKIGGSVEDFLAKANASYDKFLEEEKQRKSHLR